MGDKSPERALDRFVPSTCPGIGLTNLCNWRGFSLIPESLCDLVNQRRLRPEWRSFSAAMTSTDMHKDPRAFPRSTTFLTATMQVKGKACPVKVKNLSPRGAMIEAPDIPEVGCTITVTRGELGAAAEVVWTEANHFGVRFTEKVDVPRWSIEAGYQSDSIPCLPAARPISKLDKRKLDLDDTILLSRISDEISYLGRVMETISDVLSSDPLLRHRHARSIQDLVISEEMLDQIAAVLRTGDRLERIRHIVTGSMRGRLLRS